MNINQSSNLLSLPGDAWTNIVRQMEFPFSLSCTCKHFHHLLPEISFNVYLTNPQLNARALHIEQQGLSSPQAKIKALYQSLIQDVNKTEGGQQIKQSTFNSFFQFLSHHSSGAPEEKDRVECIRIGACLSAERFLQLECWLEDVSLIKLYEERVASYIPSLKKLLQNLKSQEIPLKAQKIHHWFKVNQYKLVVITLLNFSFRALTKLPKEVVLLTHLQALFLNDNQLTSLPAEMERLTNLQVLDLTNNKFTSLPAEMGRLTNLQMLDLTNNKLTSLPAEMGRLTNLQVLYKNKQHPILPAEMRRLDYLQQELLDCKEDETTKDKITRLNVERFIQVSSWFEDTNLIKLCEALAEKIPLLKEVLENLKSSEIPLKAQEMRDWLKVNQDRLEDIKVLTCQGLTKLPKEITLFTHLEELHLNNNQLVSLPAEIGKLSHLQILVLSNNQLTSLPAEIGKLIHLHKLCLDHNQLTSLPAEIGKLAHLQMLTLGTNQLTSLPAEIGKLAHLQVLTLGTNQLTSLPAEIGKLAHLQMLTLGNNQLTSLPKEMGWLIDLQWLDLNKNPLTSMTSHEWSKLMAEFTKQKLQNHRSSSHPSKVKSIESNPLWNFATKASNERVELIKEVINEKST